MNEENRIRTLQEKINLNKVISEGKISLLESQKEKAISLLAFYVFEEKLRSDTLSESCLNAFNMNNIDNTRFNDIMELREVYKENYDSNVIPVEVKFIIEELVL